MSTPTLTVRAVELFERPVRLRMPFRFGVMTLTEAPQCFVRERIEREDGTSHWGAAAELLAPKWFDKNLTLSNEDNFDQLRLSLALAADAYTADRGARHTVSLVDTIAGHPGQVNDGLPESLEDVIATYGRTYFKLKVGGDLAADLARLSEIAAVLDKISQPYHVSLDGNEQYDDIDTLLELWRRMQEAPRLRRLVESILFIEQPIARAHAFDNDVSALSRVKPVIVDESDDSLEAFPRARALGYSGISMQVLQRLLQVHPQCRALRRLERRGRHSARFDAGRSACGRG
ncbi:MAG: enolase C-terminal domain-like protein [Pseudolabrys sp.]